MENEVLSVEQAAKLLQKSPRSIRDLLRAGKLPGAHVGREWRLSRQAVEEHLRSGAQQPKRRRAR